MSTMVVGAAMRSLHDDLAWFVVMGNGVAGLWAGAAHWLTSLRSRALWWFTAVVQLAIFVEVAAGVVLYAGEDIEAPQFHMFYGFVAIASVGIIYSYRQQLQAHLYLLYGGGGLFLMGLAIRAMVIDADEASVASWIGSQPWWPPITG